MADVLTEAQLARAQLHQSTYWAAAQKQQGSNHLWQTDIHLGNVISALTLPLPPPTQNPFRVGMVANVAGWGTPMQQNIINLGCRLIREDRGNYAIAWAGLQTPKVDVIQLFSAGDISPFNSLAWAYELDNEPYNNNVWINGDYKTWANQMLASAKALRAKTNKPIILPFAQPWNNGDVNGEDGILLLHDTVPEIFNYLTAMAIHPYSQPEDWKARLPVLDKWRSNLRAIGHDIPFWVTEIGWPTGGTNWPPAQTETQQSDWTIAFINEMKRRGDVAVVMVYDMQDFGPRDNDSEHYFGALHVDGSAKTLYGPLKAMIGMNP